VALVLVNFMLWKGGKIVWIFWKVTVPTKKTRRHGQADSSWKLEGAKVKSGVFHVRPGQEYGMVDPSGSIGRIVITTEERSVINIDALSSTPSESSALTKGVVGGYPRLQAPKSASKR